MRTTGRDTLVRKVGAWSQGTKAQWSLVFQRHAAIIERRMKHEHVWQNRTGQAERTLQCQATATPNRIYLVASHGVVYGALLETIQQGRFAILSKTVRSQWGYLLRDLATLRRGGA